jgi:hypothetical protein
MRFISKKDYVYLNVSFSEKNIVKKLGAKWNEIFKLWYMLDDHKYDKNEIHLNKYRIIWKCMNCNKIIHYFEETYDELVKYRKEEDIFDYIDYGNCYKFNHRIYQCNV